ncbi:MAG: translation initiation factor IF-2, partial [Alphaproteobacteria bacterium]|nr:translation initiation factor IF-2 [Alphaproteobacteria bacterium]
GQGRSKSVVVEKKRKRTVTAQSSSPAASSKSAAKGRSRPASAASQSAGGLSKDEMAARAAALAAAHLRAAEDERVAEQRKLEEAAEAATRAKEEAQKSAEAKKAAEAAAREAKREVPAPMVEGEPEQTVTAEPEAPSAESRQAPAATAAPETAPPSARARPDKAAPAARPQRRSPAAEGATVQEPLLKSVGMTRPMIVTRNDRPEPKPPEVAKSEADGTRRPLRSVPTPEPVRDDDEDRGKRKAGGKVTRTAGREEGRVRGKLTIANAFDERQRERSLASLKRKREREKLKAMGIPTAREKIIREVVIPEAITIQELANRMTERAVDVIKYLMKQDEMHKINDVIDADTAELIVTEFGHTAKRVSEADVEEGFFGSVDAEDTTALETRAPVVTIMGHVDHGKTSLLDAIREAKVASGEAGGITQHIGAYQVTTDDGFKITFIDTPGHEAFTAMRARGAKVTDLVILVVAADDGVMPQTVEAINHAKAANVPMIVAINKIDVPAADANRVRTELLQHSVVVESMSGETLDVEVSALKHTNLDGLLEAIQLQSELLDLKANPDRSAEGFVIEAKLERGRGPVGTLLVQRGTLGIGDIVVAGTSWGRVRALINDHGENVSKAGPSAPVEVLGFDSAPEAGDQFAVVENESRAREITEYRVRKRRETLGSAGSARTLEQMMQQLHEAGQKEFSLVIKGDVQGSVEAIIGALAKISTDEVQARVVHSGVGGITESDISLAAASNAVVIGFNVRANAQAKSAADRDGIEIRYYNIIYDLVDDVKVAMSGMLNPTLREIFLGNAEIREVFNISKTGKVAGCLVTDGRVERGAKVRLIRDNVVIHEGTLSTLKRFKDEVKEVPAGQECGMAFANYEDIRAGDVIECFRVEVIQRSLD